MIATNWDDLESNGPEDHAARWRRWAVEEAVKAGALPCEVVSLADQLYRFAAFPKAEDRE